MTKMTVGIALAALLASLAAQPEALAQEIIYKWMDEEGVVHYTARPPEDVDYEIVDIETRERVRGGASNDTGSDEESAATESSIPPEQPEMAAEGPDPAIVAERCEQARSNIQNLTERSNVLIRGEDGERRQITDEERQGMLQEARDFIDEWC